MTERMTTQEIVKAQCEREGEDFKEMYTAIHQGIADGSMRAIRDGNTLLLYTITEPHVAEAHLITSEPQPRIVEALRGLAKGMQAAGFVRVTADLKTPSIAPLLRRAGIPFTVGEGNRAVIGA